MIKNQKIKKILKKSSMSLLSATMFISSAGITPAFAADTDTVSDGNRQNETIAENDGIAQFKNNQNKNEIEEKNKNLNETDSIESETETEKINLFSEPQKDKIKITPFNNNTSPDDRKKEVLSDEEAPKDIVLSVGETCEVSVKGQDDNKNIKFEISNDSIAEVDENGAVTLKSEGLTLLTVTDVKNEKKWYVPVLNYSYTDKLVSKPDTSSENGGRGDMPEFEEMISNSKIDLNKDRVKKVSILEKLFNRHIIQADAEKLKIVPLDDSVISVDSKGKITGLKKGITVVTVIAADETQRFLGSTYANIVVEVKDDQSSVIENDNNNNTDKSDDEKEYIELPEDYKEVNMSKVPEEFRYLISPEIDEIKTDISMSLDKEETKKISVKEIDFNGEASKADSKDLIFIPADKSIVSVDKEGNIKGLKAGITVINITSLKMPYTQIAAQIIVLVKDNPEIKDLQEEKNEEYDFNKLIIEIIGRQYDLKEGDTEKASLYGWNFLGDLTELNNESLLFENTNDEIAEIDKDGNITAKKAGTDYIIVKSAEDGRKKGIIEVNVSKADIADDTQKLNHPVYTLWLNNYWTDKLGIGENFQMEAYTPEILTANEVEWKSSNEDVLKVDGNGKVTAVGKGEADITVQAKTNQFAKSSAHFVIK